MSRAVAALVLEVTFFALAFGWRSWVQWRRTGSTGFIRPRRGAGTAELVGSGGFVLALALLAAAPIADLAGVPRIGLLDAPWAAAAGIAVGVAGVALTLVAQLAMGDSWRIGVDPAARTELVTGGVFGSVRNPIFTAMVIATVGLVLLVPNVVSIAAFVVLVAALEVQVRLVEEPYLRTTHGPTYDTYLATVGRFLPRVGLQRGPTMTTTERDRLVRRGLWLAALTIGWNVIEAVVAISAGIAAGSLALVAFGFDSVIEVLSAWVVVWQFRGELRGGYDEERERKALKAIAVTFFVLAAYVVFEAGRDLLFTHGEADESTVGIVLAALSLAVMPTLAIAKRRTAIDLGSPTLRADAQETFLCAWLSAALLAGLALNAAFGWWWADSLAALAIAALAVKEGREAWEGDHCDDD